MKRFLLSAHDGDKFALYSNSSLLSIASSLIFSRPCLSCHTTDRKPPSMRLVQMQWILLLLKLTLSQWKFAEMELTENPVTFSLPFASCNPPVLLLRAWFFIGKVKTHCRGQSRERMRQCESLHWREISRIVTAHLLSERCWACIVLHLTR